MAYSTKKKNKAKEMKGKECSACGETQHNVPKSVEESKKIKPKEVFGSNYQKKSKK
jgi:Zn ribbon nucleic-acid-binding protein